MLGLWGDSSDNIPGVPKIGQKTAQQLINAYGPLEVILAQQGLPPRIKRCLEPYKQQALLSKKLATIITTVDLAMALDDGKYQGLHAAPLRDLLYKLEFHGLSKRLLGTTAHGGQLFLFPEHLGLEQAEEAQPLSDLARYNQDKVDYHCL